jgi:2-polyprenyl-6-methoxyphenol hydroxylase-like FAD-dependent oxidoreductase
MLPTIGQGAATAREDGVCVGRMIASPFSAGADLVDALAAFDQARRARCRQLAHQAILLARAGCELGDGWRQPTRNTGPGRGAGCPGLGLAQGRGRRRDRG